ncbi:MAG: rod shape-determining protein MreC [Bacteroidota bacterium]|nr:rod shape-determining protein MreC [Bacteroidota bacterium]
MRNVILFIRKYSNFLLFLLLQITSLSFLFRYNKYHEAAFMNIAGELTGNINQRYSIVEYYFRLKKINEQLAAENTRLNQLLKENYEKPGGDEKMVLDTIQSDSIRQIRKYTWQAAKVVGGTVNTQVNFITIHRGLIQGVKPNMGVMSPQGIVGTVVNASDNYASVMTLLHRQYKVVVKLKNGGERGTVEWDGVNPMFVKLKDIPKSAKLQIGDSVVTSPTSSLFPGNLMVGTIAEIIDDKSSNFYLLKVKPSTNFFNIEYVYVIANGQLFEQKRLEDSTRKKFQ